MRSSLFFPYSYSPLKKTHTTIRNTFCWLACLLIKYLLTSPQPWSWVLGRNRPTGGLAP